jgi:hypothetical protein
MGHPLALGWLSGWRSAIVIVLLLITPFLLILFFLVIFFLGLLNIARRRGGMTRGTSAGVAR